MDKKNNKYIERILELVETSTMHGLPNAVRTKNIILKIFWVLAFLACFAYSCYTVCMMIIDYLNFGVLVNLEMKQNFDFDFPSITFCNLNPVDYSIKSNVDKINDYIYQLTGQNETYLFDEDQTLFKNNKICTNQYIKDVIPNNFRNLRGYSLEKMFISCSFDNKPCSINDFRPTRSFLFGNSYSFNVGKNFTNHNISILKGKQPGMFNGFKMELYVGMPEYQPCWEKDHGALVVMHDKDFSPLYLQEGIMIQPGVETNIILNRVEIYKQSKPYSDCIEDVYSIESFDSNSYKATVNKYGIYRQIWCIFDCAVNNSNLANVQNCNKTTFNSSFLRQICLNDFSNISNYYEDCSKECPVECNSYFYNKYLTHSEFPTKSYSSYLLSDEKFLSKFTNKNVSLDQLKKSVVSFNVYFDSTNVQKITEQPKTVFEDLLGNLGGQLGLFLGISFLSFAELFEILFEIILLTIKRKNETKVTFLNE